MQLADDQIRQAVEDLWSRVLGLPIEPRAEASFPDPACVLTGCVAISGAWQGAVSLDVGPGLARRAAAVMFGIGPDETSDEQVRDALGELTNILGGQVKSLLPGSCRLSLPAVAEGVDFAFRGPRDRVLARLDFACLGAPARVTIVEGPR